MKTILRLITQLVDFPSTDPDDARRRKLLNILLLGLAIVGCLALMATISVDVTGFAWEGQDRITAYLGSLGLLVGATIIFAINRFGPGWLASALLLASLVAAAALTDEPAEVADGRGLLVFAIPIMMGSVILPPFASFIVAGMSSLVVATMAFVAQELTLPNPFAMLAFFMLALVSWLASHNLEQALRDLRSLNRELDQRVQDRTQELAEALAKNQAILEGIADGVIVFDNDGKAVVANPAISRLLKRSNREILGQDIVSLMQEEVQETDQDMVVGLLKDANATPQSSIKFQWGERILSTSLAPVHDADRTVGSVAVFRDFTREAEIDRMKSTFVAIASHELRTPLNAILGYVEMLQEGIYGPLSDQQLGAIRRVVANTDQLMSLANNLLDRAQIEAGKLSIKETRFAPARLISNVRAIMEVTAHTKGLELTTSIAEEVPATLVGDQQRLHQLLLNLISNAIKFTTEGKISVRAYLADAAHWTLEISDTGCGIPPSAQSYIFDAFRQADEPATREYGGAGLGLSIVKQIVTLMGGEITLESEVGEGSTFTVILPLVLPLARSAAEANRQPNAAVK